MIVIGITLMLAGLELYLSSSLRRSGAGAVLAIVAGAGVFFTGFYIAITSVMR